MKNGENFSSSRRNVFKTLVLIIGLAPILNACKEKIITLLITISGTNHLLGHKLRTSNFPKPSKTVHTSILIVGGGITGLSAARQLSKKGITDFLLVELENQIGGNSSNGENMYSKYPLGAHYLPLPNIEDGELLAFLEEEKVILGYENGYPIFDETQLSFDPKERLFYKNSWQEDLIPKTGNTEQEETEIKLFFEKMNHYRSMKNSKNQYLFAIPLSSAAKSDETRKLDQMSMKQWLNNNNFKSEHLFQYVDYCCRDDFGLGIDFVSAFAGIHYFAARKQNATANSSDSVLTWPEGNARLANYLKKYSERQVLKNHLVFRIALQNNKAIASIFDNQNSSTLEIIADKIIMATPQFVNQYLLQDRKLFTKDFHYAPWLLATLVVDDINDNFSFPLCWDNVIHGSKGLGYIYDQHQSLQQLQLQKTITYYCSFSSSNCAQKRKEIYSKSKEYWKQFVLNDLKIAHPNIEGVTQSIEIHLLGHGMISPVPGFIFGESKQKAAKSIDNTLFFAHSDLSGISIFEEAFHQGISVVNQLLSHDSTLDT